MSILLVQPSRHFVPVRSLSLWRGELPAQPSQHFACQVIRSAAPVTQNRLSKPEGLSSLAGNQRPDLLTALMNMSLVLCLPRKMRLCRSSSNVPRLPAFLDMPQNPHVLLIVLLTCCQHCKNSDASLHFELPGNANAYEQYISLTYCLHTANIAKTVMPPYILKLPGNANAYKQYISST